MIKSDSTCLQQRQEPTTAYNGFQRIKTATVHQAGYPPLKRHYGCGAWRKIPWINLRGHWLEQVGFSIGTGYQIEVYDNVLILTVEQDKN